MLMAKAPPPAHTRQPGRGWKVKALAALAVLGVVLIAWNWGALTAGARADAAYAARIACSCRHVAGRDLDACEGDLGEAGNGITLSENAEAQSVTARALLLTTQTAQWRKGAGCVLEAWHK